MNATLFAISIKVVFDNLKLSIPYSLREKDRFLSGDLKNVKFSTQVHLFYTA